LEKAPGDIKELREHPAGIDLQLIECATMRRKQPYESLPHVESGLPPLWPARESSGKMQRHCDMFCLITVNAAKYASHPRVGGDRGTSGSQSGQDAAQRGIKRGDPHEMRAGIPVPGCFEKVPKPPNGGLVQDDRRQSAFQ
jgi:hypothetical protein